MAWIVPGISSFTLVASPLQSKVVGLFPSMGCMVPQMFAARGNRSYLEFWAVIDGLQYLGYITPTVSPQPSVERVARAGHSTMGGTCTHMVMWALLWDLAVRLGG
jgi:hypothetical protein